MHVVGVWVTCNWHVVACGGMWSGMCDMCVLRCGARYLGGKLGDVWLARSRESELWVLAGSLGLRHRAQ